MGATVLVGLPLLVARGGEPPGEEALVRLWGPLGGLDCGLALLLARDLSLSAA
jgi:hypothetical protein